MVFDLLLVASLAVRSSATADPGSVIGVDRWLAASTSLSYAGGEKRDEKQRLEREEGKRRERGRRGTTGKGRKTKEGRNDGRRGEEQLPAAVGSGRLVAGTAVRR